MTQRQQQQKKKKPFRCNLWMNIIIIVIIFQFHHSNNTSSSQWTFATSSAGSSSTTINTGSLPRCIPRSHKSRRSSSTITDTDDLDRQESSSTTPQLQQGDEDEEPTHRRQHHHRRSSNFVPAPPWNPSSLINSTTGLLKDIYPRIPGEWENEYPLRRTQNTIIPTPSSSSSFSSSTHDKDMSHYCRIRQVPGDGNCLFHSISVGLNYLMNHTHYDLSTTATTTTPPSLSSPLSDNNNNENDKDDYSYYSMSGQTLQRRRHRHYQKKLTLDDLYIHSQYLRDECVKYLRTMVGNTGTTTNDTQHRDRYYRHNKKLYLQGREYVYGTELIEAAAQQYNISSIEYCNTMAEDCVWGGGPEIVVLCNILQRPIHVYELISTTTTTTTTTPTGSSTSSSATDDETQIEHSNTKPTTSTSSWTSQILPYSRNSEQPQHPAFVLRRLGCFGSPKYDHKKAIHILSADSRFPDVRPGQQLSTGNHFLAVFPIERNDDDQESQQQQHRNHHQRRKRIRGGDSTTSHRWDVDTTGTDDVDAVTFLARFEPMNTVRHFVTQYIEWWHDITDRYFC